MQSQEKVWQAFVAQFKRPIQRASEKKAPAGNGGFGRRPNPRTDIRLPPAGIETVAAQLVQRFEELMTCPPPKLKVVRCVKYCSGLAISSGLK